MRHARHRRCHGWVVSCLSPWPGHVERSLPPRLKPRARVPRSRPVQPLDQTTPPPFPKRALVGYLPILAPSHTNNRKAFRRAQHHLIKHAVWLRVSVRVVEQGAESTAQPLNEKLHAGRTRHTPAACPAARRQRRGREGSRRPSERGRYAEVSKASHKEDSGDRRQRKDVAKPRLPRDVSRDRTQQVYSASREQQHSPVEQASAMVQPPSLQTLTWKSREGSLRLASWRA